MGAFFTAILAKIVGFATWIGALAVACFAAFWLLGTDLGAWLFEQVLNVVILVMDSIPFDSETFNPGTYIAALPDDITNMLGLIRLGECLAIISAAIVIKILLQLVPFTRLGS